MSRFNVAEEKAKQERNRAKRQAIMDIPDRHKRWEEIAKHPELFQYHKPTYEERCRGEFLKP